MGAEGIRYEKGRTSQGRRPSLRGGSGTPGRGRGRPPTPPYLSCSSSWSGLTTVGTSVWTFQEQAPTSITLMIKPYSLIMTATRLAGITAHQRRATQFPSPTLLSATLSPPLSLASAVALSSLPELPSLAEPFLSLARL